MIISRSEKLLLASIPTSDAISFIRLRSSLGWEVSRFAEAFIALEKKGLIDRSGSKVKLSDIGIAHSNLRLAPEGNAETAPYLDSIKAPQLNISQPYLPSYQRFIAAKSKKLYTGGASVDHPE